MSEASAAAGLTPGAQIVELPRSPGKPKGYPKPPGSGRKPGQRNRRTIAVVDSFAPLMPKAKRALKELLQSKDDEIRLKAVTLIHAYYHGKPIERHESASVSLTAHADSQQIASTETITRAALRMLGKDVPPIEEGEPA